MSDDLKKDFEEMLENDGHRVPEDSPAPEVDVVKEEERAIGYTD